MVDMYTLVGRVGLGVFSWTGPCPSQTHSQLGPPRLCVLSAGTCIWVGVGVCVQSPLQSETAGPGPVAGRILVSIATPPPGRGSIPATTSQSLQMLHPAVDAIPVKCTTCGRSSVIPWMGWCIQQKLERIGLLRFSAENRPEKGDRSGVGNCSHWAVESVLSQIT